MPRPVAARRFRLALIFGVVVVVCALVVVRVPSCRPPSAPAPASAAGDGVLQVEQTPREQQRTLASLRQVDDFPLFVMTHYGPSPKLPAAIGSGSPAREATVTPVVGAAARTPVRATPGGVTGDAYACTVFVAAGDRDHPVVGRNFDWDHHPALALLADPPDGYASVSIVDISYLGYDLARARGLMSGGTDTRRDLLRAVTLPFDGMNEHGLVVAMASLPDAEAPPAGGRPTVGSIGIMRLLLDGARTVPEAVEIFDRHHIDFTGGPPLHYLVADATGASAVLEYVDGDVRVTEPRQRWQLMVNFTLAGSTAPERAADWRYQSGTARLRAVRGRLDWRAGLALLHDLRQGHTQWSVTYEPVTGAVHLSTGQRYDRIHELQVPG